MFDFWCTGSWEILAPVECQLRELPVEGSASWGKCQLEEMPVGVLISNWPIRTKILHVVLKYFINCRNKKNMKKKHLQRIKVSSNWQFYYFITFINSQAVAPLDQNPKNKNRIKSSWSEPRTKITDSTQLDQNPKRKKSDQHYLI